MLNVLEVIAWLGGIFSHSIYLSGCTYVLVQSQTSERAKWILLVRPGEGIVEDVDWSILEILRLDNLDVQGPSWIVAFLNGIEEVFDMVIRLLARQSQSGC